MIDIALLFLNFLELNIVKMKLPGMGKRQVKTCLMTLSLGTNPYLRNSNANI